MTLFRLMGFALRIIGSFFFVFLLQIQFDGKTLESYLNNFGKKFIVTKSLQKVSQNGVQVIRSFSSDDTEKKLSQKKRQPASSKPLKYFKDLFKRVRFPEPDKSDSN